MPLEEVIAGFTGVGFAAVPPTIPGLQALGIFGTGKDGKNTNRAPGGPAFSNLTNPPTYGTAWMTVNSGTVTPTQGLDTNVIETTTVRDGGWTMFAVARMAAASGTSLILSTTVTNSGLQITPSSSFVSSHPAVSFQQQAFAFDAPTAMIDLGAGTLVSAWRMYALAYAAGTTNRPFTVFDVTGSRSTVTNPTAVRSPNGHFLFGAQGAAVPSGYLAADEAASGVCTTPLTLAQLQTIRTWLLGVLAVRGVTGF